MAAVNHPITDADFLAGMGVTGTVDAPYGKYKFVIGDDVYIISEYTITPNSTSAITFYQAYVVDMVYIRPLVYDDVSKPASIDPKIPADGLTPEKSPWFYRGKSLTGKLMDIHESLLFTLDEAKAYVDTQQVNIVQP